MIISKIVFRGRERDRERENSYSVELIPSSLSRCVYGFWPYSMHIIIFSSGAHTKLIHPLRATATTRTTERTNKCYDKRERNG